MGMHWQQITMIVLWAIGGTVTLIKHGKPKGNFNIGLWIIAFGIEFVILYSAGFFDKTC